MDTGEVEGRTAARRTGVADAVTTAGVTVYAIVFLRIAFGLWMLYHEAWEKLHTWTPQTLPRIIGMWAKNPEVVGFYRSFLQDVAAPNAGFFRGLVTSWELVFALCMLAGLGVRVLAPIQVFANLNYILAKTYSSPAANIDCDDPGRGGRGQV